MGNDDAAERARLAQEALERAARAIEGTKQIEEPAERRSINASRGRKPNTTNSGGPRKQDDDDE